MLKRVVMIIAVSVILAVLHSSDTSARYLIPSGGWLIGHGTTFCQITVGQAQDVQKAGISCEFTILNLESACLNPQGNDTRPGQAFSGPPKKIQGAAFLVNDGSGFGKKGKKNTATGRVSLDELQFFTSAELCPNENWILLAVLPTVLEFRNEIFACVDLECSAQQIVDITTGTCTLDSQYSLFNNPPPSGTPYNCVEISHEHFD